MGARSGSNYLTSLKRLGAEIWLGGERVGEVTSHPAFRNCARSTASLYDMQMERPGQMTYRTDDGGRSGLSFIQPKSVEDLRKRARMTAAWANFSGGMLRHTSDYANAGIAAMAAARDFFAASDPRFGDNIANYYLEARQHDWCATYAIGDPRDHELALRVVEKTGDGIIVKGARMFAPSAPLSEELLILPSIPMASEAAALAFAIPCNTKGLKFIGGDSIDHSRSRFDAPLSSRFAQIDCAVIFDEVMVPWSRVFLCGDVARCNAMLNETSAAAQMMNQTAIKNLAQAEFMLGLAARIAEVTDALGSPDIRDRIAQILAGLDTTRSSLRAAEADAAADQWGIFAPARAPLEIAHNLFAKLYPQMVKVIRNFIASHPIAMLSERDFASPISAEIEKHYAGAGIDAREMVALYRLANDALGSAFTGRQVLPFSDPVMTAAPALDAAHLQPMIQRIKDFLARKD